MIRSTFYGFTTAVSGLKSAQTAMDVIGQNVSNANTDGYTRQRVIQTSVVSNTTAEKYGSSTAPMVGQGSQINSLAQVRDTTLDTRFRTENASVGRYDAEIGAMSDIESIFDEAQTSGLRDSILALQTAFSNLSANTGLDEYDTLTRAAASSMAKLINQYSQQIEDSYNAELYDFVNGSVADANDVLKNLAIMDATILSAEVAGDNPLELYDQRNDLLDQLSSYGDIDYHYEKVQLAPDIITNTLHVSMKMENGQSVELINGVNFAQFGVQIDRNELDTYEDDGVTHKTSISTSATDHRDEDSTITDNKVTLLVSSLTADTTKTFDDLQLDALDEINDYAQKVKTYNSKDTVRNAAINAGASVDDLPEIPTYKKDMTLEESQEYQSQLEAYNSKVKEINSAIKEYAEANNISSPAYLKSLKTLDNYQTDLTPTYGTDTKNKTAITNGILMGSLNMLNAAGDYENGGSTVRGYKYYANALDTLANQMATQMNAQNRGILYTTEGETLYRVTDGNGNDLKLQNADGTEATDADGNPIQLYALYDETTGNYHIGTIEKEDGNTNYTFTNEALSVDQQLVVDDALNNGKEVFDMYETRNLFTETDGVSVDNIRASNISVSSDWLQGIVKVTNSTSFCYEGDDNSGDNLNTLKFEKLFENDTEFRTSNTAGEGILLFTGGFEDFLSSLGDTVALDVSTQTTTLDSYNTVLDSIDSDRMSISGVSIDEEAVDIYKFQRAYQAASRVITAMDELLDKLINGTGTAGL
jgi:flagellar hook-associated protein FlgK